MDSIATNFIICTATIVGGIVILKVFFSSWGLVDKKWNPEKIRIGTTPETAFKDIKGKLITIKLKNGDKISNCKYEKTLFFNDGEMAMNTVVYFQVKSSIGNTIFIAGSDVALIEQESA